MDAHSRKHIIDAWKRNALYGLFIDLSDSSFIRACELTGLPTETAFEGARELSNIFKKSSVPIVWVTFPDPKYKQQYPDMTQVRFSNYSPNDAFTHIEQQPHEIVAVKYETDVTTNATFSKFVNELSFPVFLVAGVHSDICVWDSILGILRENPTARIIVCEDGVDINNAEFSSTAKTYLRQLKAKTPRSTREQISRANNEQVQKTLDHTISRIMG